VRIFAKLEGFNPGARSRIGRRRRCSRWNRRRQAETGQGDPRLDLGQHRNRAGDARRDARLSGRARDAFEREPRAQENRRGLRREDSFSDPMEGSDGAIVMCRKLIAQSPERYFKPTSTTTRPTRWRISRPPARKSGGRRAPVTHFVAAIGTGGTVMGTGRFLKSKTARSSDRGRARRRDARTRRPQAYGQLDVPGIYHEKELDDKIQVGTEEAYEWCTRSGRPGPSWSGNRRGCDYRALKLARSIREGTSSPSSAIRRQVPLDEFVDRMAEWRPERLQQVSQVEKTNNSNGTYPRTLLPSYPRTLNQGADPLPAGEEVRSRFQYSRASVSEEMASSRSSSKAAVIRSNAR